MPSIQNVEVPKPKNWQDFETITRDALALRWNTSRLQKNGRAGQKQDGVDISGPDEIGRLIGVQCKRYKEQLKLADIVAEVELAKNFDPNLSALFIATTNDHDSGLQKEVRTLSDKRVANGDFAVAILFWDEIVSSLMLNPAVFSAHYPQFNFNSQNSVDHGRLIAALELGYYGSELWEYIVLIFGEAGFIAQADPDELIGNLRVMESHIQQLLSPDDAEPILASLAVVRDGCLAKKKEKSDWDPVEVHAKRVERRLQAATSLIDLSESNALDLGLHLGLIFHSNADLTSTARDNVKAKTLKLLSKQRSAAIEAKFSDLETIKDGYRWAPKILSFIDHELRYRS